MTFCSSRIKKNCSSDFTLVCQHSGRGIHIVEETPAQLEGTDWNTLIPSQYGEDLDLMYVGEVTLQGGSGSSSPTGSTCPFIDLLTLSIRTFSVDSENGSLNKFCGQENNPCTLTKALSITRAHSIIAFPGTYDLSTLIPIQSPPTTRTLQAHKPSEHSHTISAPPDGRISVQSTQVSFTSLTFTLTSSRSVPLIEWMHRRTSQSTLSPSLSLQPLSSASQAHSAPQKLPSPL